MVVTALGQVVQDVHQQHGTLEGWLGGGQRHQPVVDLHDGRHPEGDAQPRTLHHLLQGVHHAAVQPYVGEEVGRHLYRYLMQLDRTALMLFPDVLQVAADQRKVVVTQHLDIVTHDAPGSGAVFDEVELQRVVLVQGIVEAGLVSLLQVVAVDVADRRYLDNQFSHGFFGVSCI